jgi:hypothetical protein
MKNNYNRFDKIDFIAEISGDCFVKECVLLSEMVAWMSEDDFDAFCDRFCRNWGIEVPWIEEE